MRALPRHPVPPPSRAPSRSFGFTQHSGLLPGQVSLRVLLLCDFRGASEQSKGKEGSSRSRLLVSEPARYSLHAYSITAASLPSLSLRLVSKELAGTPGLSQRFIARGPGPFLA